MPIEFNGTIEDVITGESKNGFFSNITISTEVIREDGRIGIKRLEFFIKDPLIASQFDSRLGDIVHVLAVAIQNRFGIQLNLLGFKEI